MPKNKTTDYLPKKPTREIELFQVRMDAEILARVRKYKNSLEGTPKELDWSDIVEACFQKFLDDVKAA